MSGMIVISEERLVELVSEVVAREVASLSLDSIDPTGGSTAGNIHRPWYTFKTLGELVGVDERTLRRWEREGRIPAALRIGGCVRWPSDVIDRWVLEGCPVAE
jgi:predicted DNA-binding transcriptional regulator AlpA